MNKFSFIKRILEHEKFETSQKEQFLRLVANELSLLEGNEIKTAEKINIIMNKLRLDNESFSTIALNNNNNNNKRKNHIFDGAENPDKNKNFNENLTTLKGNSTNQGTIQILRELLKEDLIDLDLLANKKTGTTKHEFPNAKTLHKPLETKNFLTLFNNSDNLKYLTHRFNDGKRDYEEFMELCRIEFNQAIVEYKNVPIALIRRIEEFAFSEKAAWFIRKGNQKIEPRKGWSEKNFVEWYKKDINGHPGNDSKWNNEMIIPFKETIEVIAGNLPNIIDEAIDLALGSSKDNFSIQRENFEESILATAEFYTDVDKLQNTLFLIFSVIKEVADRNLCFELKVTYENETIEGGNFKKLIITHIASKPTKNSNDPAFAKGDLKSIQNNLWGLCNYEITGEFPDGFRKRIFLTDDISEYENYVESNKSQEIDSAGVIGFSHILKFY